MKRKWGYLDKDKLAEAVEYYDKHKDGIAYNVSKSAVAKKFGFNPRTFNNYVRDDKSKRLSIGARPGLHPKTVSDDDAAELLKELVGDACVSLSTREIVQKIKSIVHNNPDSNPLTYKQLYNWSGSTFKKWLRRMQGDIAEFPMQNDCVELGSVDDVPQSSEVNGAVKSADVSKAIIGSDPGKISHKNAPLGIKKSNNSTEVFKASLTLAAMKYDQPDHPTETDYKDLCDSLTAKLEKVNAKVRQGKKREALLLEQVCELKLKNASLEDKLQRYQSSTAGSAKDPQSLIQDSKKQKLT